MKHGRGGRVAGLEAALFATTLSEHEAAGELGIALADLVAARKAGLIAATQTGVGAARYAPAEVERYLAAMARERAQAAQGGPQ